MGKPVILSACRTPGGKFGGSLKGLEAPDLGAIALKEAMKRSGVSPKTSARSSWATDGRPEWEPTPHA